MTSIAFPNESLMDPIKHTSEIRQRNIISQTSLLLTYTEYIYNFTQNTFVCFVALRPKSTAMVMAGWSVHLNMFVDLNNVGVKIKLEILNQICSE